MSNEIIFVYMTASSKDEAVVISKALLEKKLVACANIFPEMTSMYVWNKKLETSQEVAVIFKTTAELFTQLKETVLGLHSYECPALVSLPVLAGNPDFLKWVESSTSLSNS